MQEKHWLQDVQEATSEWRDETIEGETTPRTQAIHTAVEAAEVADVLVKGETYSPDAMLDLNAARTELGDVVVAHLGTVEMLGLDASELLGRDHDWASEDDDVLGLATTVQYNAVSLSSMLSDKHEAGEAEELYAAHVLFYADLLAEELGSTLEGCVDAALEKNGAREWEGWQSA